MKYNLANQSKVCEELDIQAPEQTSSLPSASSTEVDAQDAAPDDHGGEGDGVPPKTPVQKRAASDEAVRLLMGMTGSTSDPESGSDHEWRGSQSQGAGDDGDDEVDEEVQRTGKQPPYPHPPSTPPHPHPHPHPP